MKKIFNIILVLASVVLYPACHYEIDDVFDQQSAIRIQEEMERVNDVLKSAENGWLLEYYGATSYGGYNLLCKFNDDNTVLAQSEWYGEETATSHYKFEQSQGVVLSFDEYNEVIHFFSDPANPAGLGTDGDGMEGDFEFRVMSANENEVILTGKKHGSKIVMKPLAADLAWNAYLTDVYEINEATSAKSYIITSGDKSVVASAQYRQLIFMDEEIGVAVNVPYLVTDKGLRLYRNLTFNGKTVSEFVYSAEDDKLYAVEDNALTIEKRPVPLSEAITTGYWFIGPEGMSQPVLNAFLAAKAGSAAEQVPEKILAMWLGTGDYVGYPTGWGFVFLSGGYIGALHYQPTVIDDDTIKLTFSGKASGDGVYYFNNCGYNQPASVFNSTFDLTTDNIKSPSWIKMTYVSNPNIYLTVYASEIMYPFE